MRMFPMPYLFDSESNERIGPATATQYAASIQAGDFGHILIDDDGNVVADQERSSNTHKVYVA